MTDQNKSGQDKYGKYGGIINKATLAAGGVGVPGALSFGLDVTAMAGIWGTMIIAIADKSGREIDKTWAAKVASGVATGIAAYIGGSKLAVGILGWIPVVGWLPAMAVNSSLNAWFTHNLGRAMVDMFEREDFQLTDVSNAVSIILTSMGGDKIKGQVKDMMAGNPLP
jgi:uncharacterized protein (DUF697 family)